MTTRAAGGSGRPHRWPIWLIVVGGLLIGAATLPPTPLRPVRCYRLILCGEAGLSDIIANLILFAPWGMGWGAAKRHWTLFAIGAVSLLCAGTVETLQILIPGRHANPWDVVTNTLGAMGGAWTVRAGLRLGHRLTANTRLAAAIGGGIIAWAGAFAWLTGPSFPDSTYFGQWTPDFGHLDQYGGRILSAAVGTFEVPSRDVDESRALAARLERQEPVTVRFVAGPPPDSETPVFDIADEQYRKILSLTLYPGDRVSYRERMRANVFRLAAPHWFARWESPPAVGDTVRFTVTREARAVMLSDGRGWTARAVLPVTRAWSLVYFDREWTAGFVGIVDLTWIAGACLLLGFAATTMVRTVLVMSAVLLGLFLIAMMVGLDGPSAAALVAAAAGTGSGAAMGSRFRRRLGPAPV